MKKESLLLRKSDLLLLLCVILISLLLLALLFLPKQHGKYATVKAGSDALGVYRLDESREIPIKTTFGENTLVIEDGYAYIKDADCPDRLCVKTGKVSEVGECIVCLPHRLSIVITE